MSTTRTLRSIASTVIGSTLMHTANPPTRAFHHVLRAHVAGVRLATAILAFCFEFGLCGVDEDLGVAERLYTIAGECGTPLAQIRLAFLKTHGRGVIDIDQAAANRWRSLSAEAKSPLAWLHSVSECGLAPAQYTLALCYYNGVATEVDDDVAMDWCTRAADQGLPVAQTVLGNLYMEGTRSTPQNTEIAMRWYIAASEQREAAAIFNIGLVFERGLGSLGDRSMTEAMQWYTRAAAFGSTNACNVIGILNEQGVDGTKPDLAAAVSWYTRAATRGHPHAQYNLARCYHDGLGVPHRDDTIAVMWFTRASSQGHESAQLSLAIAHEFGIGTPKDMQAAEHMYTLASQSGSDMAHRRLVSIIAHRLYTSSRVLLRAKPCLSASASQPRFCSLPMELLQHILQYLDPNHVLDRAHVHRIFTASTRVGNIASSLPPRRSSTLALTLDTVGADRLRNHHVHAMSPKTLTSPVSPVSSLSDDDNTSTITKLVHDFNTSIKISCHCDPHPCSRINHVISALDRLDLRM